MKKTKKALMLILALCTACSGFTACGEGSRTKDGKMLVQFLVSMGEGETSIYQDIANEFNSTNTDNIFVTVNPVPQTEYASALSTAVSTGSQDLVNITDELFKTYVNRGYLEALDGYIADSTVNADDIYGSAMARYTYDKDEMTYTGSNAKIYALPKIMNTTMLFYNETYFDTAGIEIISVAESELDAYNTENGTAYLPHGYYEYPANYSNASLAGKKVFNNRIALNWEETVLLASYFTKGNEKYCLPSNSSCDYGFYTEWWFSYGWSVGGDCLEYDEDEDKNVFTLGDKMPNYLVTKPATVNGTSYTEGDTLSYMDKKYVYNNPDAVSTLKQDGTLYALPSQYDAFCEFLCLADRKAGALEYVDDAHQYKPYEVSPNPTTMSTEGKSGYFASGKTAMLIVEAATAYSIKDSIEVQGFEWNVAPVTQYREYNTDGTLKTVNSTPIVGEQSGFSSVYGWAIPSKSRVKDEAYKFIEYLESAAVQKKLLETGLGVPVLKSLQNDYISSSSEYLPKNRASMIEAAEYETVGDWAYLEDGDWVDTWSSELNTDVRNGEKTVEDFLEEVSPKVARILLRDYEVKKSELIW